MLEARYAIRHSIALLGEIGYQSEAFSGTNPITIEDAIWSVGPTGLKPQLHHHRPLRPSRRLQFLQPERGRGRSVCAQTFRDLQRLHRTIANGGAGPAGNHDHRSAGQSRRQPDRRAGRVDQLRSSAYPTRSTGCGWARPRSGTLLGAGHRHRFPRHGSSRSPSPPPATPSTSPPAPASMPSVQLGARILAAYHRRRDGAVRLGRLTPNSGQRR